MAITPVLRDDNGNPLTNRGSEVITKRYANVGTTGQAISLTVDVKEVLIHIEGSVEAARFTGTVSGSEQVRITHDGVSLHRLALVKEPNSTIMTVAAPSGTVNVSVIAWR